MKSLHKYKNIENEVELKEDGSIDIFLTDCDSCHLNHTMEKEEAEKLFKAMSTVFSGTVDSIVELLQIMDKNGDDPQWISAGETVFERLLFIVEQQEGRDRLEELFPHYS